jgi:hypothetical protein
LSVAAEPFVVKVKLHSAPPSVIARMTVNAPPLTVMGVLEDVFEVSLPLVGSVRVIVEVPLQFQVPLNGLVASELDVDPQPRAATIEAVRAVRTMRQGKTIS